MDASQAKSLTGLENAKITIPQRVVHRAFPTETVLLNLQTGKYHGLNPTAGRMFEVLEETGNPREAATRLAADFELPLDTVEADLAELCTALVQRGLMEVTAGSA